MGTMWALVANSSYAEIFEIKGHGREIKMIHEIDFPDGRKRDNEINSDRPGRTYSSVGYGRSSLGTVVDPHGHEQRVFAHQLMEILVKGRDDRAYEELALIAPPHFLGILKIVFPDGVKKCITKEIGKDLPCSLNGQDKISHICKYLDLWNAHSH